MIKEWGTELPIRIRPKEHELAEYENINKKKQNGRGNCTITQFIIYALHYSPL
jgi:hypothetical protein